MLTKDDNLSKINGNLDSMTKFLSMSAKTDSFDPDTDCFVVPYSDGTKMTSMNKHVFVCAKVDWPG